MQNRVPVARESRPPLPDFAPVPRQCLRHDGWTPERQRAFIEALADTGSVSTACRMVNMASVGAYALRRHPQAAEFRRAWEAALDMGVQRLKDEAFDRAINGQLVPVFVAGKLLGYRRKRNDRLLMFCLRHYGQDAQGKRVTINYFSNRATAGGPQSPSPSGEGLGAGPVLDSAPRPQPLAQASTTTLRTSFTEPARPAPAERDDAAAATLAAFEGAGLDPQAQAEILAALVACAERRRALPIEEDPEVPFVALEELDGYYAGELESGHADGEEAAFIPAGELPWELLGDDPAGAAIDEALAGIEAHKALPEAERVAKEAEWAAESERQRRNSNLTPAIATDRDVPTEEDEAAMDWRRWDG